MKRWLLIVALLATAVPAQAHHMKGLPHFGYKDMGWYPQIPSKETIRKLGRYLVIATTMPGDPKAGTQVNMHIYVKDLKTDRSLDGAISVAVSRRKWYFLTETVAPSVSLRPIMEQFNFAHVFAAGGDHTVQVVLPDATTTGIPVKVAP